MGVFEGEKQKTGSKIISTMITSVKRSPAFVACNGQHDKHDLAVRLNIIVYMYHAWRLFSMLTEQFSRQIP